jgi:NADP-dependent 3-hydroxy acid dehydrogenase YdfG
LTATKTNRVVIVTGCSSELGHETVLALAGNGIITYATMGDTKKGSNISNKAQSKNFSIKNIELDVDNDKSEENAIKEITINENRIDNLVSNIHTLQHSNLCQLYSFCLHMHNLL